MKIHMMGASFAGSTTLGKASSVWLGFPYFDTDDYFWEPSGPLFTIRRNPDERSKMIQQDLAKHSNLILGGSLTGGKNGKTPSDYFSLDPPGN